STNAQVRAVEEGGGKIRSGLLRASRRGGRYPGGHIPRGDGPGGAMWRGPGGPRWRAPGGPRWRAGWGEAEAAGGAEWRWGVGGRRPAGSRLPVAGWPPTRGRRGGWGGGARGARWRARSSAGRVDRRGP